MPWWFFNKTSAFKFLGFKKFFSESNYFFGIKNLRIGKRFNDRVLYEKALYELKNNKKSFIYIATMETHLPYNDVPFEFSCKNLKHKLQHSVDFISYLKLIHKEDEHIGWFLRKIRELNKKVLVVFFGDHKPYFAVNLYKKLQKDLSYIDYVKFKHSTPFYIYANFLPNDMNFHLEKDSISANYLLFLVLKNLFMPKDKYFYFLNGLSFYVPVISPYFVKYKNTYLSYEECKKRYICKKALEVYELLFLDTLIGNQYIMR
jgi:hypothetical protein